MFPDTAPNGGNSGSGDATGGDADDSTFNNSGFRKRANDNATAGGNAFSGNSSNTSGGDVENIGGPDSTIGNTGGSK